MILNAAPNSAEMPLDSDLDDEVDAEFVLGGTPADFSPITLTLEPSHCGQRLDKVVAGLVPQFSRSRLQQWFDEGHIMVDGKPAKGKSTAYGDETIVVVPQPAPEDTAYTPEAIALDIVYEDDAIIVINKPAGLVVHPGSGNWSGTLLNGLLHHCPQLVSVPRAGIVHRLDKDTSGLMVVAKTLEAHTDLVRQLAARTVAREYVAVARGDVTRATIVDAPIGRHPIQRTTMAVVAKGKPARTHVKVIERFGAATLLRCTLETGRTHQIRVHLAAIGHPLVGDPSYGPGHAAGMPAFARQALHATRLTLVHPVSRKTMTWDSPPPNDLAGLIEQLRATRAPAVR